MRACNHADKFDLLMTAIPTKQRHEMTVLYRLQNCNEENILLHHIVYRGFLLNVAVKSTLFHKWSSDSTHFNQPY